MDIVERLRMADYRDDYGDLLADAAAEIERLRSEAMDHALSLEILAKGAERAAEIERMRELWFADADPRETSYSTDFYKWQREQYALRGEEAE